MTILQRIVDKVADVPALGSLGDLSSQLSGMAAQVSALANAGVGLPGINDIGGQISSIASQIATTLTADGNREGAAIANQIASIGTQMASGGMTGMAGLAGSMSSLTSQLSGMMNLDGMAQTLHKHILDKVGGITHDAFQGQHVTKWNPAGIAHQSIAMVKDLAPQLPKIGNLLGSDAAIFTKGVTASGFSVSSDARLKDNIKDYTPSIDDFMALAVKSFLKRHIHTVVGTDGSVTSEVGKDEGDPCFGFIAQETQPLFPELVSEFNGFLTVDEPKVSFILWAILQQFVAEQRAEIAALKQEIETLKNGRPVA
ncbi:tail fiber domain-containing protein [Bradyrhizobium sp. PMVTL-01]|uniref:tail fiber domain-containing protein n=1 Tax=Bradyrhizobium sp. PMVTL-01 TaxID=3434999 RepID=UPI003F6EDCDC